MVHHNLATCINTHVGEMADNLFCRFTTKIYRVIPFRYNNTHENTVNYNILISIQGRSVISLRERFKTEVLSHGLNHHKPISF